MKKSIITFVGLFIYIVQFACSESKETSQAPETSFCDTLLSSVKWPKVIVLFKSGPLLEICKSEYLKQPLTAGEIDSIFINDDRHDGEKRIQEKLEVSINWETRKDSNFRDTTKGIADIWCQFDKIHGIDTLSVFISAQYIDERIVKDLHNSFIKHREEFSSIFIAEEVKNDANYDGRKRAGPTRLYLKK